MPSNGLFVRLYLDESIYPDLAEALRQHGVDCTCAVEEQMLTKTDGEQLEFAAAQGRCIVSFNVRDFRMLSEEWARTGRQHAGIVVTNHVGRNAFGSLMRRILDLVNRICADEMRNLYLHI